MPAKQSSFQGKSITFVTSIPIPEAPMGRGWADIHMVKAFLYALVLTIDELRKFNCKSKTKQCRTPHGVYYIQLSLASDDSIVRCQECFLYTYTGVGLSALLVSTYRAMRRPIDRGTSDRMALRFFLMYQLQR